MYRESVFWALISHKIETFGTKATLQADGPMIGTAPLAVSFYLILI